MEGNNRTINNSPIHIQEEDLRLIQEIRNLGWGRLTIEVKNGAPVMIHESVKDIKLTK